MKSSSSHLKVHVFICTADKVDKPCCAKKNGQMIRDELKKRIDALPEIKTKVRINASGCLDKCTEGVACVIYPHNQWFTQVTLDSIDSLVAHIKTLCK